MNSAGQSVSASVGPDRESPDYLYIRYVTLGQFLKGLAQSIVAWAGLSIVSIILEYLAEAVKGAVVSRTFLGNLPTGFWIWLGLALCSWFLRGQTILIPNVGFLTWLVTALCFGGIMLVGGYLQFWAASPIAWALALIDFGYYMLVETGKANYKATLREGEPPAEQNRRI